MQLSKYKYMPILLSIIWAVISYFLIDRRFFMPITSSNMVNYIGCKLISCLIVYQIICFPFYLIENHGITHQKWKAIKLTVPIAILYLFLTFFFMNIEARWYAITAGDTGLIYDRAIQLKCYNDFHFLTSWCYIVALMLNPSTPDSIVYFKTVLWIIFIYYMFYRMLFIIDKFNFPKKRQTVSLGFIYLMFLFMPVIELITNCHRIYWYAIFYGLFFAVLSLDYLEEKVLNQGKLIFLSLLAACISQWRSEGIMISVMFPPLLIYTYRNVNIKIIIKSLLMLVLFNSIIFVPQNIETFAGRNHYSDVRLHPLYSYRITLMLKEGLDRNLYADELNRIDNVISIEAIDRLNSDYGESSYSDGFIRWKEGYTGVREEYQMELYRSYVRGDPVSKTRGFGSEEYMEYALACKTIFKKNIPLYLKTCFKTFAYVEKHGFEDGNGTHRLKIGNFLARFSYSLIIMGMILCFLFATGIAKHNKFWILYVLTILGQTGIVFIMSPGAYYKYYFPMCFATFTGLIMYILMFIQKRRKQ